MARLDDVAADHLAVLHRTLREDPAAFGLYEAACAAGERLTAAATDAGALSRDSDDFAARFTAAVGGEGGTMAEAAVRRAAAATAGRLLRGLEPRPEASGTPGRGGLAGDLFCLLYQWFFADVVAEFLRTVIAEKVKLVVPLLPAVDPEDHIADWVAERVLQLLPNPCEEVAKLKDEAEPAQEAMSAVEDPLGALRLVAGELVPRAAGRALGLLIDAAGQEDSESENTHGEEPAA
ncbi:hypothetical protein [Streptomyces sp. NPDC047043]|uniref:hypothetical protein n=1 Tax=Streptomyces sp. NPDC047043 TaxID=3154497 RepID=UPI0033FDA04B